MEQAVVITYNQRAYRRNREERIAASAQWNREHPDKRKATLRRYAERHREAERERSRSRYLSNKPAAINRAWAAFKQRREQNPVLFIVVRLRARLHKALTYTRNSRRQRTMELVGCDTEHLRKHIEKQFKPRMGWHNRTDWEIDHIRPICSYDLSDSRQRAHCFNYRNLQPLWRHENRAKGAKWKRIA